MWCECCFTRAGWGTLKLMFADDILLLAILVHFMYVFSILLKLLRGWVTICIHLVDLAIISGDNITLPYAFDQVYICDSGHVRNADNHCYYRDFQVCCPDGQLSIAHAYLAHEPLLWPTWKKKSGKTVLLERRTPNVSTQLSPRFSVSKQLL